MEHRSQARLVKEFRRILGTAGPDNPGALEAFAFNTEAQRRDLITEYGAGRVFPQSTVLAIKEKPATSNSEAKVRARFVMADLALGGGGDIATFVANVDGNTTRMMAQ